MSRWQIRTTRQFDKAVVKLDRPTAKRLLDYLDAVADSDDPYLRGKALKGRLSGLWRYRVGDYRILAEIIDEELVVLVLGVGRRSEVYDG